MKTNIKLFHKNSRWQIIRLKPPPRHLSSVDYTKKTNQQLQSIAVAIAPMSRDDTSV